MVVELVGSVPGPDTHVTLCALDEAAQVKVTVPGGMVSGVGLKELLRTLMVVTCPPAGGGGGGGGGELPYPVLLLLQAAAPAANVTASKRRIRIEASPLIARRSCHSCPGERYNGRCTSRAAVSPDRYPNLGLRTLWGAFRGRSARSRYGRWTGSPT